MWLAEVGRKRRPVVVLTRDEVLDVRTLVTVAEITTQVRGTFAEVSIAPASAGIDEPSVVNADGIHTIAQTRLTRQLGALSGRQLRQVCDAVRVAIGC